MPTDNLGSQERKGLQEAVPKGGRGCLERCIEESLKHATECKDKCDVSLDVDQHESKHMKSSS